MSRAGDAKKRERVIKKSAKEMVTPYENMSPRKQKMWDEGANRLLTELRRRKDLK
jgi:hypothetical protein